MLMTTKLAIVLLMGLCGILSQPASAESLEDFLKRALRNEISSKMYHPDGKYIQLLGAKELALTKSQLLQVAEQNRQMGAQIEILDFKILNKYETGDIVSAVFRARFQQSAGSMQAVGKVVSHELLMKKNGSYVSVFSIGRQ